MIGLAELQEAMASSIRAGGDCTGVHRPSHLPAGDPLSVYRNNHRISLTGALAVTFDLTCRTIGAEAFAVLAHRFLAQYPPEAPCVAGYGAGFATYLSDEPLVADYPYLVDVARLDWAINKARMAPDTPAFAADTFERLAPDSLSRAVFEPHPSLTVLESNYPLLGIARLAQHPDSGDIDFGSGSITLLIWRRDGEVAVSTPDPDLLKPLYKLLAGRHLSEACESLSPDMLPRFFQTCIFAGLFAIG